MSTRKKRVIISVLLIVVALCILFFQNIIDIYRKVTCKDAEYYFQKNRKAFEEMVEIVWRKRENFSIKMVGFKPVPSSPETDTLFASLYYDSKIEEVSTQNDIIMFRTAKYEFIMYSDLTESEFFESARQWGRFVNLDEKWYSCWKYADARY